MKKTGVLVLTLMIILGIWDGIAVIRGGTSISISRYIIETGWYSPIWTALFSMLFGHLFLNMPEPIIYMSKDLDKMLSAVDSINIISPERLEAKNELYKLVTAIKNKRNRTGKIC